VHDILTTLRRRFPAIPVLLYPVPVQGEGAANKIAAMLALAAKREDCDVLILARGGGSLEDLWAFNEEILARAIATCPIPIVCGVGHETDVTIADFVADARAPTPTAAAEMLSPDQQDWLANFSQLQGRLRRLIIDRLRDTQQRVDFLSARLVHPHQRLTRLFERFDALSRHLLAAQRARLGDSRFRLGVLQSALLRYNPQSRLQEHRLRHLHSRTRLGHAMQRILERQQERLQHIILSLDTLSPLATLARGFAILERPDGTIVRKALTVSAGDPLRARLAQGTLDCRVEAVHDEN